MTARQHRARHTPPHRHERTLVLLHQRGNAMDALLLAQYAERLVALAAMYEPPTWDTPTPAELWHRAVAGFRHALYTRHWDTRRSEAIRGKPKRKPWTAAAFSQAVALDVHAALQKPGAMPKRKHAKLTLADLRNCVCGETTATLDDDGLRDAVRKARIGARAGHALFLRDSAFGATVAAVKMGVLVSESEAKQIGRIAQWESYAAKDADNTAGTRSYAWWQVNNACKETIRREWRRRCDPYLETIDDVDDASCAHAPIAPVSVTDDDAERETRALLETALSQLGERQSRALQLRYVDGLTLEECAESMKVSKATLKRDISAGLSLLRELLARDHPDVQDHL